MEPIIKTTKLREPLISVIVPVYGVESYLNQCVDSIIDQTYKKLEIILVDDASPDRCPEICDWYAAYDSRVKVIHKENGGPSDARNAGLDYATGDYIGFVDSDDWIVPTMYEDLLQMALDSGAEIVCCNYVQTDTIRFYKEYTFGKKRIVDGNRMLREVLVSGFDNGALWNKLYVASVFNDVRFPYGELQEDIAVLCKTIGRIKIGAFTGRLDYFYRYRSDSATTGTPISVQINLLKKRWIEIENYIRNNEPELYESFRCFKIKSLMALLYCCFECGSYGYEYEMMKSNLQKDFVFCIQESNIKIKTKIEALLMCIGLYKPAQRIWRKLRTLIDRRGLSRFNDY